MFRRFNAENTLELKEHLQMYLHLPHSKSTIFKELPDLRTVVLQLYISNI